MANLITSAQGSDHITPRQDSHWHKLMVGIESFIVSGSFTPSIVTNNEISIGAGVGSLQGRFFDVDSGTLDSVTIDNGTQGMNRIDTICFKITVNNDSTQSGDWAVIKGTSSEGDPVAPTIPSGNLDSGDTEAYLPIANVTLNGVQIETVEIVAEQYNSFINQEIVQAFIDGGWITEESDSPNIISKMMQALMPKTYEVTNTIGTWQIREYSDGYVECSLIRTNAEYTITTARGSVYGMNTNATLPIPVTLSSLVSYDVNVSITSYEVWTVVMNATTTEIAYRVMAHASRSKNTNYKLEAKICGYK